MFQRSSVRLYAAVATLLVGLASPAAAQFQPRTLNDPATGESYHIEGSIGLWVPNADMTISGEGLGIPGTTVDMKNDLGLQNQNFGEFHLVFRPTRKFKLRAQAIPMKYEQTARLTRDIVFNGQRFRAGTDVTSAIDWRAYRLGLEYDFVSRNRGFGGLLLEAKPTSIKASLQSQAQGLDEQYANSFPIPAIGGIVRYYVVPNISITGEVSGIKVPNVVEDVKGHYVDLDIYGTVNITNNVGGQIGYRSFDLDTLVDGSAATFKLKGLYFGLVARY